MNAGITHALRGHVIIMAVAAIVSVASGAPKLSVRHQQWLEGPASLLITRAERDAFLNLGRDQERDASIDRFWEIRNPNPGTEQNEFKEEFYRRVAYANAHYGRYNATEGWRSDMGRTYILFGRPQTTTSYVANQELHPIELWFYANPGVAELPAFFYVLFYEKDDISGYRFYHPYVDGPEKLLKAGGTKSRAYEYLRRISPELASASLSLIPGEPIDTTTFSGSMSSVAVVNAIQGYRDLASYNALVQVRAQRLERVTSRVDYDIARALLVAFVAQEDGEPWLHWQLEIEDPMQPKVRQGRVEYQISARLFSAGRLVLERTDSPAFAAPEPAQEGLQRRPFVYEDRMPVVPGNYRLMVAARNRAADRSYEAAKEFSVASAAEGMALSDVLVIGRHEPEQRERPFRFGGVKFFPMGAGRTPAARGVQILYQVISAEPRPAGLEVEYVIGNLATKFRKTFLETLDLRRADRFGALLTAKTLPLEEFAPGAYQLAVRIKDPRTGKIAARATGFAVSAGEEEPPPIVVSRSGTQTPQWAAANHYERALCWLAQDRLAEAVASLEASWKLSGNTAAKGLLERLSGRTGQKPRMNANERE